MRSDQGVSSVVGAILVLAGLMTFFAVYNAKWVPVRVENAENQQSLAVRQGISDWASTAEDYAGRGLTERPFTRSLPVGSSSQLPSSRPATTGRVTLATTPTLTVFRDAVQVAQASGGIAVDALFQRFPGQTLRYQVGGLTLVQGGDAWTDLRSMLAAERASQGQLAVTITALSLTGGPASQGGAAAVQLVGTLKAATSSTESAGTVRLLIDGIAGPAWKAALNRHLGASGLTGDELADCSAPSSNHYCFDTDTTDADTVDVYLRNVAAGWTLTRGTVQVALQA